MEKYKKGEGFTSAERYLAQLCERSFLSLWSYPSLFRDQGKTGNAKSSDGKEVTDLLVVFGNHVIIFSDKDCDFKDYGDTILNWKRWYKKAILKSADQVWGAERWIKDYPNRLFLDNKCQNPFPIELPKVDQIRFHRIVVAHNVTDECIKLHGGTGSLRLDTSIVGKAHYDDQNHEVLPFVIGQIDPTKGYVHVLDDVSLEALLNNLDTISDFVQYLERKEKLITKEDFRLIAAGEDDLLGFYLKDIDDEGKHDFIFDSSAETLQLEEGFWDDFINSDVYQRQQEEDKISYSWDKLIEFVANHFLKDTLYFTSDPSFRAQELNLRLLAQESRLGRRVLSKMFAGLAEQSNGEETYRLRVLLSETSPNIAYVFFLFNPDEAANYDLYREMRNGFLESICRIFKLNFCGQGKYIVGIASETGGLNKIKSYDVISYEAFIWEPGEREQAEFLREKLPFLKAPKIYTGTEDEYPQS